MSPEQLLLIPLAVGHLALFVLLVNVGHALGHRVSTLKWLNLGLLTLFGSIATALAWEAWNGPLLSWSWPSLLYGSACVVTGLIVLPVATVLLHRRSRPEGIEERETVVDFAESEGPHAFIGPGKHGWLLRMPGNLSLRLRKVECEIGASNLPEALDGLSLLHFSDMHLAPNYDRRFFEAVLDEAAAWPSDLVLFTGDLVDHDEAIDWIVPLFTRLRGRLGQYAILGNHDLDHQPDRLIRAIEESGFTDLEGRWVAVESGGATVALGGSSYPWGPHLAPDDRPPADYRILLSHSPDLFYWAEGSEFDLMLAGHNHGGQIRLPLIGPVFMPSVYSRRFDRGFFRKGGLTLHVSQGVAGQHPVRYGCLPEISRLVLRAVSAKRRNSARNRGHGRTLSGDAVR